MNITNIRVRRIYTMGRLRAMVSITLDCGLAIHDIRVIEGPHRLFIAMPSRKDSNGNFRDIIHPISTEVRAELEDIILTAYAGCIADEPDLNNKDT